MNLCKCGCGQVPKRKNSLWCHGHFIRINNPTKGTDFSKEHRHNLSIAIKNKRCGENHPMFGMSGDKNPNWKGGRDRDFKIRIKASYKYKNWRQDIFIRDDFTCQKCGKKGGELNAHHIKKFNQIIREMKLSLPLLEVYEAALIYSPLWNTNNGITYCRECHNKEHKTKIRL